MENSLVKNGNTAYKEAFACIMVIMNILASHVRDLPQPSFEPLLCQNSWHRILQKTCAQFAFPATSWFDPFLQKSSRPFLDTPVHLFDPPHPLRYLTRVHLTTDFPVFYRHQVQLCALWHFFPFDQKLFMLQPSSFWTIWPHSSLPVLQPLDIQAERHYNPLIDALCA